MSHISPRTLAVFAAGIAIRCHILPFLARSLPLLPPRTRNVTFTGAAKPLELRIRAEDAPDATSKSGKNGNVDLSGEHCRAEHP
ncbi:MAG TPA: hypothetical protein VLJ14_06070 [Ktedonobacterales bacterium]|nr:hypothetical protein [Ktedonobacterales bacterium]